MVFMRMQCACCTRCKADMECVVMGQKASGMNQGLLALEPARA